MLKNKCGNDIGILCNMARKTVKIQHAFSIAKAHSDSLTDRSVSQPHFLRLFAQVSAYYSVLEYYEPAFALAKKQVPVSWLYIRVICVRSRTQTYGGTRPSVSSANAG